MNSIKNEHFNDRLFKCEIGRITKSISRIPDSPSLIKDLSNKAKKIIDLLIKLQKYFIIKHIPMIKTLLEDLRILLFINEKMPIEFVSLHGHFLIVDILLNISFLNLNNHDKDAVDIVLKLYAIINEVSSIPHIQEWIVNHDELMNHLFHSLYSLDPIDYAVACIKGLLQMSTYFVYDLRKIRNMDKLVSMLSSGRFFLFLKITEVCVCMPDPYDAPTIQQSIQIRNNTNNSLIYNVNQSILINSPRLIDKLCILLKKSTTLSWISPWMRAGGSFSSNSNDWDRLDNGTRIPFSNDQLQQVADGLNLDLQAGLEGDLYHLISEFSKASYQADIITILYGLANGPRKLQVLISLYNLGFLDTIYTIIAQLDWSKSEYGDDNDVQRVNPNYIKKIVTLRFIYLYLDVETVVVLKKCLLISDHERNVINGLEETKPGGKYWVETLFNCYLKSGHIEKERTFLTCCLQLLFRVPNCQIGKYLTRKGMFNSLIREILTGKTMFYQLNFDIMGEFVKSDQSIYHAINKVCLDEPNSFEILKSVIISNIVDANVFIRAILLSHFSLQRRNLLKSDINYILFNFVYNEMKCEIMENLINFLSIKNLYTQNLCCVNTFLIYLICSKKEGKLDQTLKILEDIDRRTHDFLDKSMELFQVWKEFYELNSRDAHNMEFSSNLKFSEFSDIVDLLLSNYANNNKL